jgi:hypothetical protein
MPGSSPISQRNNNPFFDLFGHQPVAYLIIHIRSRKQMFTKRQAIKRHNVMQGRREQGDHHICLFYQCLSFRFIFYETSQLLPAHDRQLLIAQPQGSDPQSVTCHCFCVANCFR